jgi:hypothetical protein
MDSIELLNFLQRQLEQWPLTAANYAALNRVEVKRFKVGEVAFTLQHNPARIASTAAKVDSASIATRPCFLCSSNRPAQQLMLEAPFDYTILVNPYPIFPMHFTVPANEHTPQCIIADGCRRFEHMCRFAQMLPGFALFYNGAKCGASAPDHFHFQMVEKKRLPIFEWVEHGTIIPFTVFNDEFADVAVAVECFSALIDKLKLLPENAGEEEPRVNVLVTANAQGGVSVVVIPRRAHRPDFYGTEANQVLLSPASVDLSGVMVAPSATDFHEKVTADIIAKVLQQTCY